ncbi:MAG: alpha/beta hydrolase [Candidatus Sericytochromatia bacterium]|nr:alpha/beta hydrolase [Candidatus Sericytochromatia bacterium]
MSHNVTRQLHPIIPGRIVRTEAMRIPGFPATYPLTIYVPPAYDSSRHHALPVAYMFDGQNLFGDEGSHSGGWHIHEALNRRAAQNKAVPLVIGMHHGGVSRMSEFSPWPISEFEGQGGAFMEWVVSTLMPKVNSEWRTLTGPENTMLGGSSLGGLMSLYGFTAHPQTFGKVLAMSPSVWVNDGELIRYFASRPLPEVRNVYIDSGGKELRTLTWCKSLVDHLTERGMVPDGDLQWRLDEAGGHNEPTWRRRLPLALRYLYG